MIVQIIKILMKEYPTIEMQEEFGKDPFKLLIAVMMSARTRDEVTIPTAKKLFELADTPESMVKISRTKLQQVIKQVGFFRQKARNIHEISRKIMKEYQGLVPDDRIKLMELTGVGRKTANVVLAQYFNKPVIAVDTHVHRISNRLGLVKTNNPLDTELELYKIIPSEYRKDINRLFVRHGQVTCKPSNPMCSKCPIEKYCKKVGVK